MKRHFVIYRDEYSQNTLTLRFEMKKILSFAAIMACFAGLFFATSCKKDQPAENPMKFNPTKVEVEVGKTVDITVSEAVAPISATSSDVTVASVEVKDSKVTVKGIKVGSATVTVKDKNKKSGTFTVTVIAAKE